MDLIKRHAPQHGFSPEGLDCWIENKTEEDYVVLFDVVPASPIFKLEEKTVNKQIKEWAEYILELADDVARVGKGCPALWKKGQRPGSLLKLCERADKKIDGWLESLILRV